MVVDEQALAKPSVSKTGIGKAFRQQNRRFVSLQPHVAPIGLGAGDLSLAGRTLLF